MIIYSETINHIGSARRTNNKWNPGLLPEKIRQRLRRVKSAFSSEVWNIGIVSHSISSVLELEGPIDVNWLPSHQRFHFLADPFGIEKNSELIVLVEVMNRETGKGTIQSIRWNKNGDFSTDVVIESNIHLSYPFLLQDGVEIYCIPESSRAGQVSLYRAVEFPFKWELATILIENFSALDSTIVNFNNYWWLFCSRRYDKIPSLYIWHAKNLLGPWVPHIGNPVKTDGRSSRSAGTPFIVEGKLYRPAQDCLNGYGKAIIINRVDVLTKISFVETSIRRLEPDPLGPYPHGLHTISSVGNRFLVDGRAYRFDPRRVRVIARRIFR